MPQLDLPAGARRFDCRGAHFEIGDAPAPGVGHRAASDRLGELHEHEVARALVFRQGDLLAAVHRIHQQPVGRLADGATPEDAQRELIQVLPRVAEAFPRLESGTATRTWLDETNAKPVVIPLRDEVTSGIARTLLMLAVGAGLVLLVAWANVANLLLIRADGRQLELAVREALGASRLRIITHFFGESLVLGAGAGALALLAAWAAVRALVAFRPAEVPRLGESSVGLTTVSFVVLVSILGSIVCAAVPAIRIRRASLSITLRDGARGDTAGKTRQRVRVAIAALQIAVALVVSAGSALLLR